jgi:hypothetical protein
MGSGRAAAREKSSGNDSRTEEGKMKISRELGLKLEMFSLIRSDMGSDALRNDSIYISIPRL